jgi:hypothetical protein
MPGPTPTISTYVSDMLALENHMLVPFKSQAKDDAFAAHADARASVNSALATTQSHIMALERRLTAIGGHAASDLKNGVASVLGVAASAIDNVRKTEVSKSLRDDYSALCLASASYAMLHAAALGLSDPETAALAKSHLADTATVIMEISRTLPEVVLAELAEEGATVDSSAAAEARKDTGDAWREGAARS